MIFMEIKCDCWCFIRICIFVPWLHNILQSMMTTRLLWWEYNIQMIKCFVHEIFRVLLLNKQQLMEQEEAGNRQE